MPARAKIRPTPLNLTVLGMLGGGPLHPYAIQSRMKAWGKDRVVDVSQRATLYKTIRLLRESLAELDRELHSESGPPRLFLLETEYVRAVTAAELKWVKSVVDDLSAGRLEWKMEDLADIAKNFTPPDPV